MNRRIRVAQYGCGKMSRYLVRYVLEKGGDLVAALDRNPQNIGRDVGELVGIPAFGLKVEDAARAAAILGATKPDVCIIATRSTMAEVRETFAMCARLGINAISSCEEAIFPWNSSPEIASMLDEMAKTNGCTLSGSGYPDLYWGTLITTLAGSLAKITKIRGSSSYNVEDYGMALATGHGVGFSTERFNEEIGNCNHLSSDELQELVLQGDYVPAYMWNQNGWLCQRLGLTIISQTQKCNPQIYHRDIHSATLGMTIRAGEARGMSAVVTTETAEGITLETECIGKVYAPEEFDSNVWTLHGEPDTTLIVNRPATAELTCATIVNRLPQLIDAPPGYVTTDQLPVSEYLVKPMHEYVHRVEA